MQEAYFVGSFGRLFFVYNNAQAPTKPGYGNAHDVEWALPEALYGLIIILVLSASMSTLSSLVLVSGSAITVDLVKGFWMPKSVRKIKCC